MAYPPVVIVDKQNSPIGHAMLRDAWAQGLHYRVVAVVVQDEQGRTLLQKRSHHVGIDPGLWDISVGGHVDEGTTYETAVMSEMQEEVGLIDVTPEEVGIEFFSYDVADKRLNYFLKLFRVTVSAEQIQQHATQEVTETKWVTPEDLATLLRDQPDQHAHFLRAIYERYPRVFAEQRQSAVVN